MLFHYFFFFFSLNWWFLYVHCNVNSESLIEFKVATRLMRLARTYSFNRTKAFTNVRCITTSSRTMAHESLPPKRFRFSFYAISVTHYPARAHTRLLRSHEDVYSDPCSSFLCLGLSTLLAPRMAFDRAVRLYPEARGCSRLRLYPPRSDHQFRGATSYNGRTPLWNAREKRVGLQIFVAGEQVSIPLSPPPLPPSLLTTSIVPGIRRARATFSDEQLLGSLLSRANAPCNPFSNAPVLPLSPATSC